MRDRKKRNIVIASLCCLLVFMGIGYAILSQTLNISGIANMKGNWNVKITNMELVDETKTGRAEEVSHSFTDTTATFEANLYMPGDSIEYEVTVENQGNIDALLKSITPTTTNKNANIKFSHSEIDNTVLTAGKTISFTMKVEFLEDATTIPDVDTLKYSLELVYVQYNGGDYTPAVEPTEDDCFAILDDGTLASYDKSCGTDVVIPAKINNIPVKRIASFFLASNGFWKMDIPSNTEEGGISVALNETKADEYIKYNNGMTDEEFAEYKKTDEYTTDKESIYIYGTEKFNNLKKKTFKDSISDYSPNYYKVYKNTDNTIKLDETTSSDFNVVFAYDNNYYTTNDDANALLKEYFQLKYPNMSDMIKETSYFEEVNRYINDNGYYDATPIEIRNLENTNYYCVNDSYCTGIDLLESSTSIKTVDLSQAIYIEEMEYDSILDNNIKKVTLPPNVKILPYYSVDAEEVAFPKNSQTKVIKSFVINTIPNLVNLPSSLKAIGRKAFYNFKIKTIDIPKSVIFIGTSALASNELTSVVIPASVKSISNTAFSGNKIETLSFETGSKLKYISNNAFSNNQLTNTGLGKLPSSLTSLATNAFNENSNLTQIILTTPTDIEGWTNGDTIDGITVVYER